MPAAWCDTDIFAAHEHAALAVVEATAEPANALVLESAYDSARQVPTDDEMVWMTITIDAFNQVSDLSKHPMRAIPQQRSGFAPRCAEMPVAEAHLSSR
nr:hypothetical protein OG781_39095 [Streptomyces sp. NBC_00830]